MQRRSLLRLGLLASVTLGMAGAGVALWTPGWRQGGFGASARALWRAVAQAVLADRLPTEAAACEAALDQHLERLQATVAGLPPATRRELSQLLALLDLAPSRLALTGLRHAWATAGLDEVGAGGPAGHAPVGQQHPPADLPCPARPHPGRLFRRSRHLGGRGLLGPAPLTGAAAS